MKKVVSVLAAVACTATMFLGCAKKSDLIKIGIINNPPSESGYRAANVKDFEDVFTNT